MQKIGGSEFKIQKGCAGITVAALLAVTDLVIPFILHKCPTDTPHLAQTFDNHKPVTFSR